MAETIVPRVIGIARANGYSGSDPKTLLEAMDALGDAMGGIGQSVESMNGPYTFRGVVSDATGLPSSGMSAGDVYNIAASSAYGGASTNVAWNGSEWQALGNAFEVADGSVTSGKLANGAVTTEKIGSGVFSVLSLQDVDDLFADGSGGA